jgi:pantetheine-phosphate adenylyltransferase
MATLVYPGSFDPVTYGHLDLMHRGLKLFDELVVGVSTNIRKEALFTAQERVDMIRAAVDQYPKITVKKFDGLLVHYAKDVGAHAILRGLRALSDFEYEFQMAHMNHRLNQEIETIFLMTGQDHFYLSSSLVREVAFFGGDVGGLVPPSVETQLIERVAQHQANGA